MAIGFSTTKGTGWNSGHTSSGPVSINLPSDAADGTLTLGCGGAYGNTSGGAFTTVAETVTALYDASNISICTYDGHYVESGTPDTAESIRARATAGANTQGFWFSLTDFDTGTPIRVAPTINSGVGSVMTYPAAAGAKDGDIAFRVAFWIRNRTTSAGITGFTLLEENTAPTSGSQDVSSYAAYRTISTDEDIASATQNRSGNGRWFAMTIVVAGAADAGQTIDLTTVDIAPTPVTVTPVAVANITLGATEAAPDPQAVTLAATSNISLAEVEAAPETVAPTLKASSIISLAETDQAITIPGIEVTQLQFIDLVPIDQSLDIQVPEIVAVSTITLAETDAAPVPIAPTLLTEAFIDLTPVDAAPEPIAPALVAESTINLAETDAEPAILAPTLLSEAKIPLVPVETAPEVPSLALKAVSTVEITEVSSIPEVQAPVLLATSTITLTGVDAVPEVIAPTLNLDTAQSIILTAVDIVPDVVAPSLVASATVILTEVGAVPEVQAPALVSESTIILSEVSAQPVVIQPELLPVATISLTEVEAAPTVVAPTLAIGTAQAIVLTPFDITHDIPQIVLDLAAPAAPARRRGGAWLPDPETARQLRIKLGLEKEADELIEEISGVAAEVVAADIQDEDPARIERKLQRIRQSEKSLAARVPPADPKLKAQIGMVKTRLAETERRLTRLQAKTRDPAVQQRNRKRAQVIQALDALRKFL